MHTHVDFRVAAQSDGTGEIGLYIVESTGTQSEYPEICTVETPETGGWQTWDNSFSQNKKYW